MPVNKLHYEGPGVHSEELDEIIGQAPGGLINYGAASFLFVIILFIAVSWIIKYPDVVNGPCTLYATDAPKPVVSRSNGRLARLLVTEGEKVHKDQPVVLIHTTASYEEVMNLSNVVGVIWKFVQEGKWSRIEISPEEYKNLGELQGAFQGFYGSYVQLHTFILQGLYSKKKDILRKDMSNNDSLKEILLKQKMIYEKDYAIADSDYQVKNILYKEKVIAKMELKQEESKLLSKRLPLENLAASITNNHSAAMGKERELMELDKLYYEVQSNFIESLNKLVSDIELWKQQYVLVSPVQGTATFPEVVQENQELTSGKEVFFIETPGETCYAQVLIDQNNFGKVMAGQTVLIRLPSYPFQEYGSLQGVITYISRIPNKEKQYMAKVALPEGLQTNIGYRINFSNELMADAEIITKKTRLLYKFLYSVQGVFQKTNQNLAKDKS